MLFPEGVKTPMVIVCHAFHPRFHTPDVLTLKFDKHTVTQLEPLECMYPYATQARQ